MKKAMKLSVIVPCLNEAPILANQVRSLACQRRTKPREVIIADNGSTDGSLAIARQFQNDLPSLRVADASDRAGQAHAKNAAARIAQRDALRFCDADDEV